MVLGAQAQRRESGSPRTEDEGLRTKNGPSTKAQGSGTRCYALNRTESRAISCGSFENHDRAVGTGSSSQSESQWELGHPTRAAGWIAGSVLSTSLRRTAPDLENRPRGATARTALAELPPSVAHAF